MIRRLIAILLMVPLASHATPFTDATGRSVDVPDHIERVLPAGPPAAALLAAVAPDLMLGWPGRPPEGAALFLADPAGALSGVPRVTGRTAATADIAALHPDLILDYGDVSERFTKLAASTQEQTGVPTVLLDGALAHTPDALRQAGHMLHREARAEGLARLAEAVLAAVPKPDAAKGPSVVYARGTDGLDVAAPATGVTEIFTLLGWRVLAPPGEGTFRHSSVADIAALDPDRIIFADAGMRAVVARSTAWRALRAVRTGHAMVAPATPFGWVEEPPSLNRLLGLAMLSQPGFDTIGLQQTLFDRPLDAGQRTALEAVLRPLPP